jgi:hypothetical protein
MGGKKVKNVLWRSLQVFFMLLGPALITSFIFIITHDVPDFLSGIGGFCFVFGAPLCFFGPTVIYSNLEHLRKGEEIPEPTTEDY